MKVIRVLICLLTAISATQIQAQEGDQILDGIGETGLVARYVFDGDFRDWSRNNLHGEASGEGAAFVNDRQFGKVLSLGADQKAYVSIPANALDGLESVSMTGWVFLRSGKPGQRLLDFGNETQTKFYVTPSGMSDEKGFQAFIASDEEDSRKVASAAIEPGKWVHFAVVVDVPSESLTTYLNGKEVAKTTDVELDLGEVFEIDDEEESSLLIGKSRKPKAPLLDAKLHDFRIYRIPLTQQQISVIHRNALGEEDSDEDRHREREDDLPQFDSTQAQLYTQFLESVPDVEVETVVGYLPRLPRYIPGVYSEDIGDRRVRVVWPAPTDNSQVLEPGTYTVVGQVPDTEFKPRAIVTVKAGKIPATPEKELESFSLSQVSLNQTDNGNDSKFIENRDKFINTLAETNPDSFLYMFRNAFGQEQPDGAEPLGVWDSQETKLRGHATGHYLTAIAQAYASTGYDKSLQENFAEKMEYMVETLHELSELSGRPRQAGGEHVADPTAVPPGPGKEDYNSDLSEDGIRTDYWNWGEGFISAYPPDQFIMLENGATYGGQENQIWAPYYTLHKILAGLLDIYEITGNEKALETAVDMGDWVYARLSQLPKDTLISMWNRYIAGEFGGMNEAMARLYRITEDPKFLKGAKLFDNIKVFFGDAQNSHGLAKNVDTFRSLHANQHVPQIVGALEIYRGTTAPEYFHVADNFWHKVTHDYMYSIGGVAGASNPRNAECFIAQPGTLYENGFASGGQNETCATYNMLKLTRKLFMFDQRAELMDYYEQGLYNHILASVAEDSPANTYHVPLRPGSIKRFGNADMTGFTCCNGTALESSTKLQNTIYFKSEDNDALYVNLYVPSTLDWTEKDVKVEQATSFPYEDKTKLTIEGEGEFDLNVRVPSWATKGFFVKINGKEQKVQAEPGSYLTLHREWEDGDTVVLQMPFAFHLEPVMDQQNIASLFYGPVLLAAQESEPRTEWRKVSLDAQDLGKTIQGDPEKMHFQINGVEFKPFYDTYGRHSVYLDVELK